MTKVATVDYHYRSGTVEALARSLIVASTLHSGKGPFQLPMTSVQALALGRALEWAARMQATHAAREAALAAGAIPATLGYRGFEHSCCTSINHVICHGIPGPKPLKDGDIVNIDVTVIVDGWHGDTSRMYLVGDVPIKARRLVDVTYECLMLGIEQAKPGNRMGDVAHAIQKHAEAHRYSVVRDFCGHGVGRLFHDAPEVVHAGQPGTGPELRPGMFFTIEPMINAGKYAIKILDDGWTAVSRDRSLSAQFEHSIGITENGCEIFTQSARGWHAPPY